MSKGFGKIVFASTVLATAAVGAYAFLKKEGILDTLMENPAKDIAAKVSNDAADIINKERSYVDLSADEAAPEEAPAKDATAEDEVVEDAPAKEFEPGIMAENIEAAEDKIIGSTTSEEFFNDEDK